MGNDFCKGCQDNCLNNMDQNFSNSAYQIKPEENIIFRNSEYTDNNKTSNSVIIPKDEKYYLNRINNIKTINDSVDKKKLNQIILKYKIQIIIKSLKKFKSLKKRALKKIVLENYYISNPKDIYNQKIDIDISPKQNYTFIGHKFNSKKEGYGLEIYNTINARYLGGFKNGKKDGYCRYSIYNSDLSYYYFGQVSLGQLVGFGYYENCKNGSKYEGDWYNSSRNGYGIEYYDDGSFYKGEFKNGTKSGIGIYKWVDKSSYTGEWNNNCLHGYGEYIFSDGSKYIGHWKYNKMDGMGEFINPSKKTYFGFYKLDIKEGFGILFSTVNKKAFIGFWSNNKQNGFGQFINGTKSIFGCWKEGKMLYKIFSKEDFFKKLSEYEKIYISNFNSNNFDDFYQIITKILSL